MNSSLQSWLTVPHLVEKSITGLADADLDRRAGPHSSSIRENVHHILESNLIAVTIMLAALARDKVTYDWSWVYPNAAWMQRMNYTTAPIAPALATLRALCKYYAVLIDNIPDALSREVQLLDAPGAALYSKTVEGILEQEYKHAEGHLAEISAARSKLAS